MNCSSGTKYGLDIQMRRFASWMAWRKKSVQVSNLSAGPEGRQKAMPASAVRRGLRFPIQHRGGFGRPIPIFEPRDLHALHDWARHFHMRVAPCANLRVEAKVFVAHIVSADEGNSSIDDDRLAMVAEVELKAIRLSLPRVEGTRLDPAAANSPR
jgi:hypothetical protein